MAFFMAMVRAGFLLVLFPIGAHALAGMFLPPYGFAVPVAGNLGLPMIVGIVVFLLGFLDWAQNPTGQRGGGTSGGDGADGGFGDGDGGGDGGGGD